MVDHKKRCIYNMSFLVIGKYRKLEQLLETNLQNFDILNWHEPGTSSAAILGFSMGSDIFLHFMVGVHYYLCKFNDWMKLWNRVTANRCKNIWCGNNMRGINGYEWANVNVMSTFLDDFERKDPIKNHEYLRFKITLNRLK
jgi:hypothetical protein